eukprot:SM000092S24537  [mRNA]  locus=s92:426679:427342:- [translate_table: standard]
MWWPPRGSEATAGSDDLVTGRRLLSGPSGRSKPSAGGEARLSGGAEHVLRIALLHAARQGSTLPARLETRPI